jgi:hypothetical protein
MAEVNEPIYTSVPVSVRLDSSGGYYEFGVTLDGAFVTFAARKTGGINDDIQRAKDEAAEKKPSKTSKSTASANFPPK